MANLTDGIGNAMPDELLRLTGTVGNPFQTLTASFANTGMYFGENRAFDVALVCKSATGSTATMDISLQDSVDGNASSWAAMDPANAFAQLNVTSSQASATGALASPPKRTFRTRTGRPYVRAIGTVGGTTGTYVVALFVNPIPGALAAD